MRIRDIHVDGFGIWNDLNLESLPGRMTVFYGPNEAGKSTLLQFIRTVFYGYSEGRRARYVPPVFGGRAGGALEVDGARGHFHLQRYALPHERDDHPGTLSVLDHDRAPCDPGRLRELLGGVDEATFNHVFAIGLREIQELGTLHDNAAADLLYQLTSGMDRVSLVEVARELADGRTRLWAGETNASQITLLNEKRDRLQAEIDELTARGRRYTDLAEQREALADEAEKLQGEIARLEEDLELFDAAQRVREPWQARIDVDKQLAALGHMHVVPESAVLKVQGLNDRIARLEALKRSWIKKSKALRAEVEALPLNRLVLGAAVRIEALQEHSTWITTLESQVERLTDEVRKLDAEIQNQVAQLGLPAAKGGTNEDVATRILAVLKTPARNYRTALERAEAAKQEAEGAKREVERALQSAERAAGRMPVDITAAIQEAGARVGFLRRRLQLEEQLEQLNRNRDELEEDADFWLSRQLLPPWGQFLVGASFIFGVMFVLLGIIGGMAGWVGNGAFPLVLFGFVLGGGAMGAKVRWEREASLELDECRRQLTVVYRQSAEAKEERDEIDAQLPTGGGAMDVRLASAEAELRELERLAPMETLRTASIDRSAALLRRVQESNEAAEEARGQWKAALKQVGLPEDFDPARVRHIAQQGDDIAEVRRRRDQRREELEQRERDLLTLSGRITTLFTDLGIKPETSRPQVQLRQLASLLAKERETLERRRDVAHRLKELRQKYSGGIQHLRKLSRGRGGILAKAGVDNETDLRRRATDSVSIRNLRKERERLTADLQARLNGKYTEDIISGVLVGGPQRLDLRRRELTDEIAKTRLNLAQLHEKRGACGQEMQVLLTDRRLPEAKIELHQVAREIDECIDRWRLLTVVERVLQTQMRAYEREKQPATLREASEYLASLTQGQYRRIWTPLSERTLMIEDHAGQSLSVELLSRGTREAIYLALRLALVSQYERKGIELPLVLDDVLVNFDTTRVKAAARVLVEFAKNGRQILMFTCHEHIARTFRDLEAEVRNLPIRQGRRDLEPVLEPIVVEPPPKVVRAPLPPPPVFVPPLPPPPTVSRIDPPSEAPRPIKKKKKQFASLPPLPPPPLPPPARRVPVVPPPQVQPFTPPRPTIDPNDLFQKAGQEELLYDPVGVLPKRSAPVAVQPPPVRTFEPDQLPKLANRRRRFTWESPEMYWEDDEQEAS